jgi:hypothetical protein
MIRLLSFEEGAFLRWNARKNETWICATALIRAVREKGYAVIV